MIAQSSDQPNWKVSPGTNVRGTKVPRPLIDLRRTVEDEVERLFAMLDADPDLEPSFGSLMPGALDEAEPEKETRARTTVPPKGQTTPSSRKLEYDRALHRDSGVRRSCPLSPPSRPAGQVAGASRRASVP
jgi:hypothetical protein